MDRRQFLAAGSMLAATLPAGAGGGIDRPPATAALPVNLHADGSALTPAQYAEQLQAMTAGDALQPDFYSNGGVVAEIERRFAALLGKQAAMFLPTGTLANHIAVRTLAGARRRVLVQAESHLYNDSGDCTTLLSGLNLVPLAAGRSTIELSEIQHWVERSGGGRVSIPVGVISIENPVRRQHHRMVDIKTLEQVCRYARERGIRLHLDGARMFNLPQHSGIDLRQHAALFDTVYVSLWKHFNAASGAILAGDADFIDGLYHTRRMFGGSLPQAWPSAAVALQYADCYLSDYAEAWQMAEELLARLPSERFVVDRLAGGTSRFFLTPTRVTPRTLAERAAAHGLLLPHAGAGQARLALQVNTTLRRMPAADIAAILADAAAG